MEGGKGKMDPDEAEKLPLALRSCRDVSVSLGRTLEEIQVFWSPESSRDPATPGLPPLLPKLAV